MSNTISVPAGFSPAAQFEIEAIKQTIQELVGPEAVAIHSEYFENFTVYNRPQEFAGPQCTISNDWSGQNIRISHNEIEWYATSQVEMIAIVDYLSKITLNFSKY
jgi:hypothetical protein